MPCVGMGLFAFSALVLFASTELYLADRYASQDSESALAGSMMLRYLLSFAFAMFALPMYGRLGAAWATSVLGFAGVVLGLVSWIMVFRATKASRRYWV